MASSRVKVKCNRCGAEVFSDEFILDPDYKMMVCQNCVREKRTRKEVWNEVNKQRDDAKRQQQAEEEKANPKPAGWDKDDELLEKLYKHKQKVKEVYGVAEVGPGKAKCHRCGYVFKYNSDINKPSACPYCANPIRPSAKF